jgi:hypothetical protein
LFDSDPGHSNRRVSYRLKLGDSRCRAAIQLTRIWSLFGASDQDERDLVQQKMVSGIYVLHEDCLSLCLWPETVSPKAPSHTICATLKRVRE